MCVRVILCRHTRFLYVHCTRIVKLEVLESRAAANTNNRKGTLLGKLAKMYFFSNLTTAQLPGS